MKKILLAAAVLAVSAAHIGASAQIGNTVITKWQDDKRGAVSITYDDGTVNQFHVALPIMNRLGIPGTFFINTGSVPGAIYTSKFVGRPVAEIVAEAKTVKTNADNVFERAAASRYVPVVEADQAFSRVGNQLDRGNIEAAITQMDEFYARVNAGECTPIPEGQQPGPQIDPNTFNGLTWDMARAETKNGHEFSSHMVTHPNMSALDEANMLYELEKSREEIIAQIDYRSSISAEEPYGIAGERAVAYAQAIYPVLRNDMGLDYMPEVHRGSRTDPVMPGEEYVQWQRGIVTRTTMEEMNGWVDITAAQNNMWLVTVIHGVNGVGWEPVTTADVDEHFTYIAGKEELWVATFGDAGRYILERMNSTVGSRVDRGRVVVTLENELDKALFDLPLTLKTQIDPSWNEVRVVQGSGACTARIVRSGGNAYALYRALPGGGEIELFGF